MLSLIGSVMSFPLLLMTFDGFESSGNQAVFVGMRALGVVICLLWFTGAVLLFRQKAAGRVLLIVLSSIVLALMLASLLFALAWTDGHITGEMLAASTLPAVVPAVILTLAAAPSTGRWIRSARPTAYPPHRYY
ncbi:hypothetical protein ACFXK0_04305 [Nocardia sp. NPDC059177]|uniref:hypothetical protein n=1 Tax=Nocardia sp. NPDC059177 TaxID=3346759 RepID=UPI00367C92B0